MRKFLLHINDVKKSIWKGGTRKCLISEVRTTLHSQADSVSAVNIGNLLKKHCFLVCQGIVLPSIVRKIAYIAEKVKIDGSKSQGLIGTEEN